MKKPIRTKAHIVGRNEKRPIDDEKPLKPRAPAGKTVESRESDLINESMELAAKQIRSGTISSQNLNHFLKIGSTQMQLEKLKIEKELKLLDAKTEELSSRKRVEELYGDAIEAMKRYSGQETQNDD